VASSSSSSGLNISGMPTAEAKAKVITAGRQL
jgi:hypothetical protein